MHWKRFFIPILFLAGAASYYFFLQTGPGREITYAYVQFKDVAVTAEIADTDTKRIQGLSGRPRLGETEGMLFIFDAPAVQQFWMKDMRFGLDVIWINEGTIQGISAHVPPPSGGAIPRMGSDVPVQYVLEVPAGFAEKYRILAGDRVDISIIP